MSESYDVISIRSEVVLTESQSVEFCDKCGCPVVIAEGAMDRHSRRIHVPPAPAKPLAVAGRWERTW